MDIQRLFLVQREKRRDFLVFRCSAGPDVPLMCLIRCRFWQKEDYYTAKECQTEALSLFVCLIRCHVSACFIRGDKVLAVFLAGSLISVGAPDISTATHDMFISSD